MATATTAIIVTTIITVITTSGKSLWSIAATAHLSACMSSGSAPARCGWLRLRRLHPAIGRTASADDQHRGGRSRGRHDHRRRTIGSLSYSIDAARQTPRGIDLLEQNTLPSYVITRRLA